ncbi:hypothetical protein GWI33_003294 [Rhynchophorus ferrugineus]|uniref:Uncharacterized protein n=1 Tax=Rhynchophorus ferrugineus TaxID=354439 RepID=A0A834IJN5_RHYFE|nr:hypothetical protein GWI33_003294 [Rhynchophorus ferrugineus]
MFFHRTRNFIGDSFSYLLPTARHKFVFVEGGFPDAIGRRNPSRRRYAIRADDFVNGLDAGAHYIKKMAQLLPIIAAIMALLLSIRSISNLSNFNGCCFEIKTIICRRAAVTFRGYLLGSGCYMLRVS